MLSLRLGAELERRLEALAKLTGGTKSFHIRELIEGNLENLEDRYLAEARLEKRRPPLPSGQVRKQLGVVRSAPAKKTVKKRVPGIDKGKIWTADDFSVMSKRELRDWYLADSKLNVSKCPPLK